MISHKNSVFNNMTKKVVTKYWEKNSLISEAALILTSTWGQHLESAHHSASILLSHLSPGHTHSRHRGVSAVIMGATPHWIASCSPALFSTISFWNVFERSSMVFFYCFAKAAQCGLYILSWESCWNISLLGKAYGLSSTLFAHMSV